MPTTSPSSPLMCDTRQQAGKHLNIDRWLDAHGVAYEYRKLDFGDYAVGWSNIAVDTKQGMDELAGDLGRDHERFARECDRARDAGWRLVILVEEHPEYQGDRASIARWRPYPCRRCGWCEPAVSMGCVRRKRKPMQGTTLLKIMEGMERGHGVRFEFCSREGTARRVCELLGVELDG